MLIFFTFISFIISEKECGIDDYFCQYINRIEYRWYHPQNNLTNEISNDIANLTNKVEKFSISMSNLSNASFITKDDEPADFQSIYVPSTLVSKIDENGNKACVKIIKRLIQPFTKYPYSLKYDFQKAWKIDGQKGKLIFKLNNKNSLFSGETNLTKIAFNNINNLNCSIQQFDLFVQTPISKNSWFNKNYKWTKVATYNLSKSTKGYQEFTFPSHPYGKYYKIEVISNHESPFTCFAQPLAFKN